MPNPHDTFGNPHLQNTVLFSQSPMAKAPMDERHWPLSKNRRDIIIAKLAPLIQYAETAPANDPGEGDWDTLETTFGCGENSAIYQAAEMIRGVLTSLGLDAPSGHTEPTDDE